MMASSFRARLSNILNLLLRLSRRFFEDKIFRNSLFLISLLSVSMLVVLRTIAEFFGTRSERFKFSFDL